MAARDHRLLLASLQRQRAHVLGVVERLDDEALQRALLPTGWSFLTMIRHLTFDIEQFWFRGVVAGEPGTIDEVAAAAPDHGWLVPEGQSPDAVIEAYRREAERSDEIISTTPLDARPAWWPEDLFGTFRMHSSEEILLHVIAETACHAGHLDAARELLDGGTWLILT